MIRILRISLRNFLSIGNITQTLDLSLHGLTLVLGENIDIAGQRNGCGKTNLVQAISYALFGEPLTNIKLDNLINHFNNKGMLVTLTLDVNGKTIVIERGRKPNVLRLLIDGQNNHGEGENKNTQATIERLIGMSHLLFTHLIALSTHTTPFMKLRGGDQRNVIEELFGITQLSERAATLKLMMDATKDQLRESEIVLRATGEANKRIEAAIERAQIDADLWQQQHDGQLADLLDQAVQVDNIDPDTEIAVFDRIDDWRRQRQEYELVIQTAQQQLVTLHAEIAQLRHDIARQETQTARADSGEITRLESQRQRYLDDAGVGVAPQLARLTAEASRHSKESDNKVAKAEQIANDIAALQQQLDNPQMHNCSTCGQKLDGTLHLETVMANLRRQVTQRTADLTNMVNDVDRCQAQVAIIHDEIARLKLAQREHVAEMMTKATAIEHDIAVARQSLSETRQMFRERTEELTATMQQATARLTAQTAIIETASSAITGLGNQPTSRYPSRESVWQLRQERDALLQQIDLLSTLRNPHSSTIDGLRGTLTVLDYDTVNTCTLRLKHETFLYKLLTAKDSFVRKSIIDQNLLYLNKRINHYLDRLQLPHEVRFLSDLTVEISFLGKDMDFEQLSRGEQNRNILATWWAFRDVFENFNDPINLLMIDEVLDFGLDDAGAEAALDVLQHVARERNKNVFLISHKDSLIGRVDRVMLVRKENQFTSFVADHQMQ